MSHLLKLLLSLSLSGSLLLLLLLALRPVYQKRLSQRWQYYIWLAVVLRFLLPITPAQSLLNRLFSPKASPVLPSNILPGNMTPQSAALPNPLPNTTVAPEALPLVNDAVGSLWPDLTLWLLLIWAVGALLLLCRQITQYQSFGRYLQAASQPVDDIALLEQLAACAEDMHIQLKKPLELLQNPLLGSPAVFGLRRPRLILPASQLAALSPEQLELIFRHELTHLRRHDLWYKWLVQFICCLHWFNPLAHLLARQINRCCELACDEAVIASLACPNQRRLYGDTLLAFCQPNSAYKNSLAAITLTEGAAQLKERLGAIMNFYPKTKGQKAAALLLTLAVCFSFFLLGAYAAPILPSNAKADAQFQEQPTTLTTPNFLKQLQTVNDNDAITDKSNSRKSNNKTTFVFNQNCFYSDGYIIEMGWNLPNDYTGKNEILRMLSLPNNQAAMPVCFAQTARAYADDEAAIQAITELLKQMQQNEQAKGNMYPEIKRPYILRLLPAPADKIPQLAEELYQQRDISPFAALFPQLDAAAQNAYWQRIYADELIGFWGCTADYMSPEQQRQYLIKAEEDERMDFFSVILSYSQITPESIEQLAEKYYSEDEIAFFAILSDYMSEEQLDNWRKRAVADRNVSFASMLDVDEDWAAWLMPGRQENTNQDWEENWDDAWDNWEDNWEENWDNWEEKWQGWEEKWENNLEKWNNAADKLEEAGQSMDKIMIN